MLTGYDHTHSIACPRKTNSISLVRRSQGVQSRDGQYRARWRESSRRTPRPVQSSAFPRSTVGRNGVTPGRVFIAPVGVMLLYGGNDSKALMPSSSHLVSKMEWQGRADVEEKRHGFKGRAALRVKCPFLRNLKMTVANATRCDWVRKQVLRKELWCCGRNCAVLGVLKKTEALIPSKGVRTRPGFG